MILFIASVGCQQKVATKPEAQPQAGQQGDASQGKQVEKIVEQKIEPVGSKDVSALKEKEGMFQDVLFDFNKYDVRDTYKPVLQSVASWMSKNNGPKLSIEGHCDERGTNEYNLALGDKRAKAVKDYLISVGVPSSRLQIISYGEEKPVCRENAEDCWTKNRRAHFVLLMK